MGRAVDANRRWVAGYGLGFGFGILLTGWISAYFNPALALAAWINGNGITSASEYFAIAFSTICGAGHAWSRWQIAFIKSIRARHVHGTCMPVYVHLNAAWSAASVWLSVDCCTLISGMCRGFPRWLDGVPAVLAALPDRPQAAGGVRDRLRPVPDHPRMCHFTAMHETPMGYAPPELNDFWHGQVLAAGR